MYPVKEYFLEDYITKLKYPFDIRLNNRRLSRNLNTETTSTSFDDYVDELQLDLASQNKSIDVFKKIQAIGTDFGLEINCDLVVSVIEYICRISSKGIYVTYLVEIVTRFFDNKRTYLSTNHKNVRNYLFKKHTLCPMFIIATIKINANEKELRNSCKFS